MQLFARILGEGLRLNPEKVETLLDLYMLELSQDRYRPSLVAATREARRSRKQQMISDSKLLDMVSKLSAGEPETPKRPKRK